MAAVVRVLLPLICVVLAEAQLNLHLPFFDITGRHHAVQPNLDLSTDNRPPHSHHDYSGNYNSWYHQYSDSDGQPFHSDSSEIVNSYSNFDPLFHRDPYYTGDVWEQIPGINNVFNIPSGGFNSHRRQPPRRDDNQPEVSAQEHINDLNNKKPEEPKDMSSTEQKPTDQDKDIKLNEVDNPEIKNNSEIMPPKTNEIRNDSDNKDKNDKDVDLNKKKDFLLVGQGNGNDVYLLHENNPNPSTANTPNVYQPGNSIVYVPYNPGQPSNPVYQIVNNQPGPSANNPQVLPNKIGVNGYNNVIQNSGQPTVNYLNPGTQNPGYVMIYSNGQLLQIPGVVVNQAPNNVPLQNGNGIQGTNYILANAVPNNMQSVPAIQNPGTNVIYATLPNQGTNSPIVVQMPNNGCPNAANVFSNNGLPGNVVTYQPDPNMSAGVSNTYAQPNMVTIPNQVNNQNSPYQPAVELPVNSGSNGYNQPIVLNQGQVSDAPNQGGMLNIHDNMPLQNAVQMPVSGTNGYNPPMQNTLGVQPAVEMPVNNMNGYNQNQGGIMNNQNMPSQPAVEKPNSGDMNMYNQPMMSNPGQDVNAPNQGALVNNQNNMQLQPAVEMPSSAINGYKQPTESESSPHVNVEIRGDMPTDQNVPLPALQVNGNSNGYNQPQETNQGSQGSSNIVVNIPSNTQVTNPPGDNQALETLASSLGLDSNNLSSLDAQPAIMLSGFKETTDGKKVKKSKDKKEKKDKSKKKDKKEAKDQDKDKDLADKPENLEPFTNKKK